MKIKTKSAEKASHPIPTTIKTHQNHQHEKKGGQFDKKKEEKKKKKRTSRRHAMPFNGMCNYMAVSPRQLGAESPCQFPCKSGKGRVALEIPSTSSTTDRPGYGHHLSKDLLDWRRGSIPSAKHSRWQNVAHCRGGIPSVLVLEGRHDRRQMYDASGKDRKDKLTTSSEETS